MNSVGRKFGGGVGVGGGGGSGGGGSGVGSRNDHSVGRLIDSGSVMSKVVMNSVGLRES